MHRGVGTTDGTPDSYPERALAVIPFPTPSWWVLQDLPECRERSRSVPPGSAGGTSAAPGLPTRAVKGRMVRDLPGPVVPPASSDSAGLAARSRRGSKATHRWSLVVRDSGVLA